MSWRGGSWKGHESGQAVLIFLTASPLVRPLCRRFWGFAAQLFSGQNRHATKANTFKTELLSFQLKGIPKDFKPIPKNCDTAP